jgi:Uma2 family endonuclease
MLEIAELERLEGGMIYGCRNAIADVGRGFTNVRNQASFRIYQWRSQSKNWEVETMTLSTEKKIWTDEEFMALPRDGHRYELVKGEVVDTGNSGMEHGDIGSYLGGVLAIYVRQHKLDIVCDSSTAFTLKDGNKRSPDISFVTKERLKGLKRPPRGFFSGSPGLAIEILSPNNTVEEIHDKIVEYFENDTRLVWVIHPDEKYVLVYHSPEPDRFLRSTEHLDREYIVPDFSMAVAELFSEWEF